LADINIGGNVAQDVFLEAINSISDDASSIAKMIAGKKRRKPLSNQQLFKKTMRAMRSMGVGKEEDILKYAVRDYLQKHYSLPVCDASAYDVSAGRGKITLKYNPSSPGSVPFGFWMNKLENKTLSKSGKERKYMKLTPEETASRISENRKWIEQKEIYKQRMAQTFGADEKQIAEIFKDNVPIRADFSGCEINGFDFSQHDLSGANFSGAKLKSCTFSKIEGANLSDAVIDGCVFADGKLAFSDFNKAVISDSSFDRAVLRGCDFSQSEPSDVTFRNALLKDTNLDFTRPKNIVFDTEDSQQEENAKKHSVIKSRASAKATACGRNPAIEMAAGPATEEKPASGLKNTAAPGKVQAQNAAAQSARKVPVKDKPRYEPTISM
jgi:hypothetical protein